MKTKLKLSISFLIAMVILPTLAFSQVNYNDPKYEKYGADAAKREENVRNYSFFRESFSMNSYSDAAKRLEELIVACPEATENMYIIGLKIHRSMLEAAETDEARKIALDNMLRMFDLRAKYFGNNGAVSKYSILGNKIREMITYDFIWDKDQKSIFTAVRNVLKESGENVDLEFVMVYFKKITDRFMSDKMHADVVLEEFELLSESVDKSIAPTKSNTQATLDALLIESGAADCDNLEKLFKPQYEKNPNDITLIKKIMRYLSTNDCETPFRTVLAEKYYKLEPSANAAYSLAATFASQKNIAKATQYYKEAITRETQRDQRSIYEFRLAGLYLINKNNTQAAEYAKKAIADDPRNGLAYFVLAQSYILGVSEIECDGFEKKAAYWLIVSTLEKGLVAVDASSPQAAEMKKLIGAARQNFPNMEDLFFKESLKVGDSYTVNCGWIKGVTKVYDPR